MRYQIYWALLVQIMVCMVQTHYPNQCQHAVNWTLNQYSVTASEDVFEYVVGWLIFQALMCNYAINTMWHTWIIPEMPVDNQALFSL